MLLKTLPIRSFLLLWTLVLPAGLFAQQEAEAPHYDLEVYQRGDRLDALVIKTGRSIRWVAGDAEYDTLEVRGEGVLEEVTDSTMIVSGREVRLEDIKEVSGKNHHFRRIFRPLFRYFLIGGAILLAGIAFIGVWWLVFYVYASSSSLFLFYALLLVGVILAWVGERMVELLCLILLYRLFSRKKLRRNAGWRFKAKPRLQK